MEAALLETLQWAVMQAGGMADVVWEAAPLPENGNAVFAKYPVDGNDGITRCQ